MAPCSPFSSWPLPSRVVRPESGVEEYIGAISTAWLGLVSLVSLLVGKPFTLPIARTEVSPEIAKTPAFIKTNQIITSVWTAYFALTAAIGAVAVTNNVPGDQVRPGPPAHRCLQVHGRLPEAGPRPDDAAALHGRSVMGSLVVAEANDLRDSGTHG